MAVEFQAGVHCEELVHLAPVACSRCADDALMFHRVAEGHALEIVENHLAVVFIVKEVVETHADGDIDIGMVLRHVVFYEVIARDFLRKL